jgi:hypothetical protein
MGLAELLVLYEYSCFVILSFYTSSFVLFFKQRLPHISPVLYVLLCYLTVWLELLKLSLVRTPHAITCPVKTPCTVSF